MGFLSSLTGGKTGKATMAAAGKNRDLTNAFNTQATGFLDKGLTASSGYLNQANGLWGGLTALGQKGANLYADALGVNGAQGNANATSAFQAGPGYQFAMDQGLGALERRAAAQGRLQSGQTGLDTIGYAQGLANQEYGNWLGNLSGYNQMYGSGVAGQAGTLGSLADLYQGDAGNRVNLASTVTSSLMGANNQWASGKEAQTQAKQAGLGSLLSLGGNLLGQAAGAGSLGSIGSFFGYGK